MKIALTLLVALALTGCDNQPHEGAPCEKGSTAVVAKDGHTTRLVCTDGIWRKS